MDVSAAHSRPSVSERSCKLGKTHDESNVIQSSWNYGTPLSRGRDTQIWCLTYRCMCVKQCGSTHLWCHSISSIALSTNAALAARGAGSRWRLLTAQWDKGKLLSMTTSSDHCHVPREVYRANLNTRAWSSASHKSKRPNCRTTVAPSPIFNRHMQQSESVAGRLIGGELPVSKSVSLIFEEPFENQRQFILSRKVHYSESTCPMCW